MRKNATKLAAAVLSLAMVMTSVNMPASAAKTKVKLNKTKATLYVNGSASEKATTLKVTVNGKKVNATFKSSNTKVLTVAKSGKVTAKKNGTAKVTATYKKKKYNCTVTVKTYATSVSITSAKTLNLAAGKTATIKATVKPSTASNKKVSFTSSNKNVATVTSAGKVTAKKAGTATVTVKALGSKKAAKKATVKVNVKAAVKPSTEPTTTPTTEPTATPETPVAKEGAITVTTNVSGATITVTSGTSIIFSKQMEGNTITTPSFPNNDYKVKLTLEGYDDAEDTVTVKGDVTKDIQMKEKTGATAGVSNSLTGHKNTVLVNDKAILTVKMTDKDGNPVANKATVLALGKTQGAKAFQLKVLGQSVATTDANGNATFVVGYDSSLIKATSTAYVGSVEYTATVVGENSTATGSISFAAIEIGKVAVTDKIENGTHYSNLKAGTSANDAGYIGGAKDIATTTDLKGDNPEYVLTQQVSSKDADHSVEFNVKPQLRLPAVSEEGKTDKYVQDINYSSEKYHTYAKDEKTFNLNVDTAGLKYASMNFDKIQLSPYTEMTIEFYAGKDATSPLEAQYNETIKADDTEGLNKTNRTVQIPLTDTGVKSVKITLKSAGQVQTNMNDGYTLKDIVYVYDEAKGNAGTVEALSGASIQWKAVSPKLTQPKTLSRTDATDKDGLGITAEYEDSTFTYEVPAFPYTGNAVITEKDKNGKIVAYYLVPTENQNGQNTKNTNDIKKDSDSGKYVKAYKATAEEVSNYIQTGVTQSADGTTVKVDSEKNGSTTLMGTLTVAGIGKDLLDATNSELYTSVQWNPIPSQKETTSDAFLAIAGQKVTLTGQLVDKNGNAVSISGQTINFQKDGNNIKSNKDVTVVKAPATTDTNGKSTIVLSAAQATAFTNVTATCANSNYSVKLSVKDTATVNNADLYWVNADLQYLSKVDEATNKDDVSAAKNTTSNNTIDVSVKDPTVGTPWEYGVKTVAGTIADKDANGKLAGYSIDINGLKIFTETADDNKGKYTPVEGKDGSVAATSDIAHNDKVSAKINGDSVTDKVTFTAKKTGKEDINFVCVGEGTPNMNAKINMNVKWQPKGVAVSMIAPQGTTMKGDTAKLYVRLTDSTGKNPLASTDVTFKSGNTGDKLASSQSGLISATAGQPCPVSTDKYGVAVVYVKARPINSDNQSSIITAEVKSMEQTTSTTINWLNNNTTPELGIVKASKTDDKQVTVSFNNEMNGDTIKPNNFKVKGVDANGKTVEYEITSAKANGKSVVLLLKDTLPAGNYTVEVNKDYFDNGITYTPADVVGQEVTEQTSVAFSSKNATYSLDLSDDGTKFEISHVSSPVDIMKDDNSSKVSANGDKTKDFTITVNGKIFDQSTAAKVTYSDTDKKFTFALKDVTATLKVGTVVKVYYMGNEEGYTVSDNDVIGLAMKEIKTANVPAGQALANLTGKELSDNNYTCKVKVVAYDDTNSLYTTDNKSKSELTNLDTIIASSVTGRLDGVALTELTTASSTEPDLGKFVKLEFTFSDGTKTIATKTLSLVSKGSGKGFELK